MGDEALALTGTVQARVRDLPSRVVRLLPAGCLFPPTGLAAGVAAADGEPSGTYGGVHESGVPVPSRSSSVVENDEGGEQKRG
ncbi:hypothetical protein [Streptomyces sp. NPDC051636]|uniref:hypothetical protein n=1 Tax=Streptomyces sp. NPDC051636 TaxID=3365663 RepID=UPI003794F73C